MLSHRSPQTILAAWNLHPVKQMGQNFLKDPSTAAMIVSRSGLDKEEIVLEIGAGLGALTFQLAPQAHKVYALEKDSRLAQLLKTEVLVGKCENVVVLCDDILRVCVDQLLDATHRRLVVVGNLPYRISSQILIRLLHQRQFINRAILMFQVEMARRITAPPGTKSYGRLAAMLQYCAQTVSVADIKAHMFYPKPRVDSQVLAITFRRKPEYPAKDEALLFQLIKAAFGKRRKTLKNALNNSQLNKERLHLDAAATTYLLETVGIDPNRRPETLGIGEFVRLSNRIGEHVFG